MLRKLLRGHGFTFGLLAVVVVGVCCPSVGMILRPWVPSCIFFSMILIGARFDTAAIRFSRENAKAILVSVVAGFVLMPLVSYFLALIFFSGQRELFIGAMLAGTVPTTQASSVIWTDLSGGNHSLAVVLMSVANLLGVFLSPWLLSWGVGSVVSVPVWPMLKTLIFNVLCPVLLGILARQYFGAASPRTLRISKVVSILLIWVNLLTALSSDHAWSQFPLLAVLTCVAIQYWFMAYASYFGSRALGLSESDSLAVLFCSAQVTITFAVLIGVSFFSVQSLLYVAVYHLFQQFMGAYTAPVVTGRVWRRT